MARFISTVNPFVQDQYEKSFVKTDVWSVATQWVSSPDMEALTGYPGNNGLIGLRRQRTGEIFIRITKSHTSQLLHFLPSLSRALCSLSEFRDRVMAEEIRGRCTEYATTTCPGADDAGSLKEISTVIGAAI